MTPKINARIRRMLVAPPAREAVHFHLHHDGRPFVCDFPRCDSPAFTLDDLDGRGSSLQG
jgi:hypothetical protein